MAEEGRYEYQEKIGEGGMATVYRGLQRSLNRPVAIKVLSATLSDNPSVIKRFERESLIIARLNHPNIIHVIDRGMTSKGRPVFVMEYVEGMTLADAIRNRVFHFNQKVDIAVQICKGVAYAHKFDVIHRDIKPANVIIDKEGFARLLDFGIASFFKAENQVAADETRLILGTEAYMAPEQHQGISMTSCLSDIYSIGVVMYELFSGQLPSLHPVPLSAFDDSISPALDNLVMKCLEREPMARPQSVEEVKTQLLLAMKGQHISEEKVNRAGEGLAAIKQKFGLLDVMREDQHGAVYLYEDKTTHKLLVIKKRMNSFAGFREAKMLQSLKHPNLLGVLGSSKNDSLFIIVMPYVSGGTLQDRLIDIFDLQRFLKLAVQMCRGLSFAHQNRILHGNLRPSNILLTADMQVKLADFGLDEHYRVLSKEANWYGDRHTQRDELSDIYSLGAIFFHALTGQPPALKDGSLVKTKAFVALPPDMQHLIGRMLSKYREDRPQSVESVLSEILPLVEEVPAMVTESTEVAEKPKTIIRIRYQRTNWLTILFAILFILSLTLNVLFLGQEAESIKRWIFDYYHRLLVLIDMLR
jgi:serine/threonine-protein kinase